MVTDEFVGQTKANIKTLFKQDEVMDSRIGKVEDAQKHLDKISYILELQQDINKEQTQTLNNINENLVNLNSTVRTLQTDMDNVKSQVENIQEYGKFDMRKFKKEFLYKVLPTVMGTLIVAYLIFLFKWH